MYFWALFRRVGSSVEAIEAEALPSLAQEEVLAARAVGGFLAGGGFLAAAAVEEEELAEETLEEAGLAAPNLAQDAADAVVAVVDRDGVAGFFTGLGAGACFGGRGVDGPSSSSSLSTPTLTVECCVETASSSSSRSRSSGLTRGDDIRAPPAAQCVRVG
jgi:hypothetical protein